MANATRHAAVPVHYRLAQLLTHAKIIPGHLNSALSWTSRVTTPKRDTTGYRSLARVGEAHSTGGLTTDSEILPKTIRRPSEFVWYRGAGTTVHRDKAITPTTMVSLMLPSTMYLRGFDSIAPSAGPQYSTLQS